LPTVERYLVIVTSILAFDALSRQEQFVLHQNPVSAIFPCLHESIRFTQQITFIPPCSCLR